MKTSEYYSQTVARQVDFFKKGVSPVVPYFITTLEIELSNYCNLDCPFCYTSSLTRNRTILPFEHYKRLVDYLDRKDLKPRISFSGDGEMFTHKRILDFVEYAKKKEFHVQIITNATLCTPEKSKWLIELRLDRIQFSIDSIKKETYEKSRRAKGNARFFEKAIYNILEYSRLNYEAGEPTAISVMSVQTRQNRMEAEEFRLFWNRFPIHNLFLSPLYTLAGNAARVFNEARDVEFRGCIKEKPVCVTPFILLCIKADGKVLACTHDSDAVYPIANIIETGESHDIADNGDVIERTIELDRVWNNERIKKLRQGLLERDLRYFESIGFDCETCNCPIGDGNIEEYKKGLSSAKVNKIWESMNRTNKEFDRNDIKYLNLLDDLKIWRNGGAGNGN